MIACAGIAWVLLAAISVALWLFVSDVGLTHPAIRTTALTAVVFWAAAIIARRRAIHLLGWFAMLIHTAAAFDLGHGWSHAAAYDHTQATAGFGPGILVNYAVVVLWGIDALCWRRMPQWLGWAIPGFIGFIMFNATVVYGGMLAKGVGVVAFAAIGWWQFKQHASR